MAGIVYECDRCVDKHNNSLRSVAKHLLIISGVETKNWDLLKLATALKIVCYPKEKIPDARQVNHNMLGMCTDLMKVVIHLMPVCFFQLFPKQLLKKLKKDARRYKNKILKLPCLEVYKEIRNACKIRLEAEEVLDRLITQVKKAHEAEQASKAASDHQIGHGINPAKIAELTECHTMLSANRKERQVCFVLHMNKTY
jgi:nucleolar protein 58